ncbi:serine--tRNA ligase [Niveispirillum cyanobacteriorum]|uniref:Serine--tRNA ligase n=1 Tax=Niveispirillum cyanobacteriorum TaxID=1612173 RepID=A0A2K9NEZ5_9PROT|nr:serine--tRNA ligase [Niveispirillum cyanobacteriorum]AUN31659.1 serine--tRNA ligase [Niveispirillum cyanobacteriorum]GGE63809.1 serine--tRNA ligase [Niveispirillum cyanobacteriorum]
MHDIRSIRDNPAAFDAGLARRGVEPLSSRILELDQERRACQTQAQELQARRNEASKLIGAYKKDGKDAQPLLDEVAAIKEKMPQLEEREKELGAELDRILASYPNIPAADVPDGKDEHDNVEIRRVGTPTEIAGAKQHFELGEALGLMSFDLAAKLSGARFTVLRGQLARLERALGDFMLDIHTTEYGYEEVSPPLLVKDDAAFGTGQLPKFTEDLFQTTNGFWLIPTAEVPLTNLVNDAILDGEELPLRLTARTPCFRSEAGSAGRDTRGMIRQHQFYKVEMVSITRPDQSAAEHERMTDAAETVLKRLGLPFRTVTLCSGDMGFTAQKTYDIEVWLPGQGAYREISSCSNCGDFQARRMKARFRAKGEKSTQFVHTLNGSGTAVGRCLIAVLENYQQADGSILIPDALRPYMGGLERIAANG